MPKADLSKRPEQVAAMFDEVAPTYDRTNDLLSFGQSRLWRSVVARAVGAKPGQSILDLAAGTGSSTVAFAAEGVRLVAGDFSEGMLAEGRKRHPEIEFVRARSDVPSNQAGRANRDLRIFQGHQSDFQTLLQLLFEKIAALVLLACIKNSRGLQLSVGIN